MTDLSLPRPEPVVHWDLVQGTDAWHAARLGKWGSSKADTIMSEIGARGALGKGLAALVKDVAWGRVFGAPDAGYKDAAMERGNLVEPESREWYSFTSRRAVLEAGLVEHATVPNVIWSPDGLIMDEESDSVIEGGIEAKNPLHKAWMDCKKSGEVPSEYVKQCQWAMWNGKLKWLDFVCYHPAAGGMIVLVEPDPVMHEQFEERIYLLEKKVSEWIDILRS